MDVIVYGWIQTPLGSLSTTQLSCLQSIPTTAHPAFVNFIGLCKTINTFEIVLTYIINI